MGLAVADSISTLPVPPIRQQTKNWPRNQALANKVETGLYCGRWLVSHPLGSLKHPKESAQFLPQHRSHSFASPPQFDQPLTIQTQFFNAVHTHVSPFNHTPRPCFTHMNFISVLHDRIEEPEASVKQVIAGPVLSLRPLPVAAVACIVKVAVIVD